MAKAFLNCGDVAERYGVSRDKAYGIIRAIKAVSYPPGFGALPCGKVLLTEVERWEQMYGTGPDDRQKMMLDAERNGAFK